MLYDVTNENSYKDIFQFWLSEIDTYAEKHAFIMIVGNKMDLGKGFDIDELNVILTGTCKRKEYYV